GRRAGQVHRPRHGEGWAVTRGPATGADLRGGDAGPGTVPGPAHLSPTERERGAAMRVGKIGEVSKGRGAWHWPARHAYRVIRCNEEQDGCPHEPGVEVLWESDSFVYHGHGPRSKRVAMLKKAQAFARHARRCLAAGLVYGTPAGVVADWLEEEGQDPGPGQDRGDDRPPTFIYYPETPDAITR